MTLSQNSPLEATRAVFITPAEESEFLSGFKLLLTVFSLTVVGFLVMLDLSVVATVSHSQRAEIYNLLMTQLQAIPKITSDFHSLNDVGWYGAAY